MVRQEERARARAGGGGSGLKPDVSGSTEDLKWPNIFSPRSALSWTFPVVSDRTEHHQNVYAHLYRLGRPLARVVAFRVVLNQV